MEEKYAGTVVEGLPEGLSERKTEGEPEKIIFTLHSARNLADKDFVGKSDPYAILTYGTQEKQTRTINNNLNPVWDHQVTFDHEENVQKIIVEVFDEDALSSFGESLGRLSIDVAEIARGKSLKDVEANLETSSSGSIKYSAELISASTSSTWQQPQNEETFESKLETRSDSEAMMTDLPSSTQIVSSEGTATSIRRVVDQDGNVVSEETETRTLEGNEDFEELAQQSFSDISPTMQVVSTQRRVTSVKKTLDEFGNVLSEDVQTSTLPATEVITTGMSSNVQLVSSEGKVTKRLLDEEGNVVSEETEAMSMDGRRDFEDVTQTGAPSDVQGVSSQSSVISA